MALGLASLFGNNGNEFDWQNFGAQGGTVSDTGEMKVGPDTVGQLSWDSKAGAWNTNQPKMNTFGGGSTGLFGSVGGALQGLGALANAYTGYKNYQFAKDQFGFEKALAQTNLANQADLINEQRSKASDVGLALAGSSMSDADKQAARDKITAANVKGTI